MMFMQLLSICLTFFLSSLDILMSHINDIRWHILQAETLEVTPQAATLVLLRKDETGAKSLNETLLSRLRPYRAAPNTAQLVALGPSDTPTAKKEDGE